MSIRKSILFGLVLIDEILREFRDPGGFVSFSYENMYGFVPQNYKKKNLYSMVYSLRNSGELDQLKKSDFRITAKGKSLITNYFPKIRFLNKPWDRKWRVVGFDIEEKRRTLRDSFRDVIYRHGFRMVQKSLYISPLPLEKEIEKILVSNKEVLQNAYVFISDKFFMGDQRDLINKVFRLDILNDKYQLLLDKLRKNQTGDKSDLFRDYLAISSEDPFLPKELLPKDFLRDEVFKELKKIGVV